jgi:hypothetical protein
MHRLLELREASLIDSSRAAMLAKVTNLQAQCVAPLPHSRGTEPKLVSTWNSAAPAFGRACFDRECCRYNALQHAVETIDKEATHAKQLLEEGELGHLLIPKAVSALSTQHTILNYFAFFCRRFL